MSSSSTTTITEKITSVGGREIPRKRPVPQEEPQAVKYFKFSTNTLDTKDMPLQMLPKETHTITGNFRTDDHSWVIKNFYKIKNQLCDILASHDAASITNKCAKLMASDAKQIPLFLEEHVKSFQKIQQTPKLLRRLALNTNWCDHSIFNAIAEVCDVPEATAILTQFDDRIDPSQPLMKFPIPQPCNQMVPYDTSTHTVLAVQLNIQLHHSTLQNVLDTRSLLQQQCHITAHCLQLLAVANTSHTIIYWTIPKHVAGLITSSVLQHQNYLHQNGIQQVAVYPGTALVTGSALTVGLFSFFTEVSFNDNITILLIIIHYRYLLIQVTVLMYNSTNWR